MSVLPDRPDRFVYLLKAGADHYKVGIAQDVLDRIKSIQTGNPLPIELIAAVYVEEAKAIERGLHQSLAEYQAGGGREWFILKPEQALELVAKLTALAITADISQYITTRNLIVRQTKLEQKMEAFLEGQRPPIFINERPVDITPTYFKEAQHDELFDDAVKVVQAAGKASASMLQRRLRVGYARASCIIDELERAEIISGPDGAHARIVL